MAIARRMPRFRLPFNYVLLTRSRFTRTGGAMVAMNVGSAKWSTACALLRGRFGGFLLPAIQGHPRSFAELADSSTHNVTNCSAQVRFEEQQPQRSVAG